VAAEWYYYQSDTRYGPVESEQIQQLLGTGQLRPSDLVWRNGMSGWSPIMSVPELAPTAPLHRFGEPPPESRPGPAYTPSIRRTAPPAFGIGKILLLAGAGLCFINFFLPWWGFSAREQTTQEDQRRVQEVFKLIQANSQWYERRISHEHGRKIEQVYTVKGVTGHSSSLMGWNTGAGLMGFIFSFAVIAPIIVAIFVVPFRAWVWIASFVAALLGLILLIFSMLWLFGSTGGSVPGLFWQGVIIGPWICLVASLLLLAGGILDGIFGVIRLARGSRAYAPAPY